MAIWQYKIYALPAEEYNTFFAGKQQINEDAFDEIKWWKYRKPKKIGERFPYLPLTKSWNWTTSFVFLFLARVLWIWAARLADGARLP